MAAEAPESAPALAVEAQAFDFKWEYCFFNEMPLPESLMSMKLSQLSFYTCSNCQNGSFNYILSQAISHGLSTAWPTVVQRRHYCKTKYQCTRVMILCDVV